MAKYTIEIDDGRNGLIVFAPIKKKLRARFSVYRVVPLSFHSDNQFQKMPDIPGQRIVLDSEAKTGRIVDPLNEDSTAELRREIARVYKTMPGAPPGDTKIVGVPDATHRLQQAIDWNTWVWHCRQLVEDGYAKVIDGGELPHVRGKVKLNFSDWTKNAVKEREVDTEKDEFAAMEEAESNAMAAYE